MNPPAKTTLFWHSPSFGILWIYVSVSYSCGPYRSTQEVPVLEDVILACLFVLCLSSYLSVCVGF